MTTLKLVSLQRQRFCGQRLNGQEVYTIDYPFRELKVSVSMLGGASDIAELEIGWDPKKTLINNASIDYTVHGEVPFSIPVPSLWGELYFNDIKVGEGGWAPWTSCSKVQGVVNVMPWLRNWETERRRNVVRAYAKSMALTIATSTFTATGRVIVTYQGEKPVIKPPPSPEEEMWNYIKWGLIGAGALGAIYLGVRIYEARKKK